MEENLLLGGTLLLKQRGVLKLATLSGESVLYTDDNDNFGNEEVLTCSVYAVECFSERRSGWPWHQTHPFLSWRIIIYKGGMAQCRNGVAAQ